MAMVVLMTVDIAKVGQYVIRRTVPVQTVSVNQDGKGLHVIKVSTMMQSQTFLEGDLHPLYTAGSSP